MDFFYFVVFIFGDAKTQSNKFFFFSFILKLFLFHFSLFPPVSPAPRSPSGAPGPWTPPDPGAAVGDIAPVPLLSTPDLDALCDPVGPALPTAPPFSSPSLSSSPHPQLTVSPSAPPAAMNPFHSGTATAVQLFPCLPPDSSSFYSILINMLFLTAL